ncbi:hypothetical protein N7495_000366 [Penicillium taxi]|uniref:uncharacterized protein n=1 Tax=Penicillium taxi TaxID=168475 RepID=UPI002544E604|nr:uncharacterized protein N7495_000366 [Penicillium taxi]KAJ5907684.1 hypothetical protein N7495_000366 [Penicillium taxi]
MPDPFFQASSPAQLDLASARSQIFQVPMSASTSLYSLSVSRKRPRQNEKISSKFDSIDASSEPLASPLFPEYRQMSGVDDLYRPNRYRESFFPPSLEGVDCTNLYGSRKRSRCDSYIASPTADDANSSPERMGWGQTVMNAVGKVLDFCWSGAFKGFHAGGGPGYDLQAGSPVHVQFNSNCSVLDPVEKDPIFHSPIPGQYPVEDKDIDRSWVVVPTEPTDMFVGPASPASPSIRARRMHQASSPRRRPAMPRLGKRASLLSTPSRSPGLKETPGSAEMAKYAARIRRREREEDASIQRLNKQLQAMIRQGKEALGTTVEVDDLDMDIEFDSS